MNDVLPEQLMFSYSAVSPRRVLTCSCALESLIIKIKKPVSVGYCVVNEFTMNEQNPVMDTLTAQTHTVCHCERCSPKWLSALYSSVRLLHGQQ